MITFDVAPEHMAIAGLCVLIAAIALVVWQRTRPAKPQPGEVVARLGERNE